MFQSRLRPKVTLSFGLRPESWLKKDGTNDTNKPELFLREPYSVALYTKAQTRKFFLVFSLLV